MDQDSAASLNTDLKTQVEGLPAVGAVGDHRPSWARRLSQRKIAKILALADEQKNNSEIARIVRCDDETVARTLDQWADMRPLARRLLESRAAKLAETVAKTKDAGVALKALGKLDVVREDSAPAGAQTVIVIGATSDPLSPSRKTLSVSAIPVSDDQAQAKPSQYPNNFLGEP